MSREKHDGGPSPKVIKNIAGDEHGLPGWYTHFGSQRFADSALGTFQDEILRRYPEDIPLTIIGLGSGSGLYDLTVAQRLNQYRNTRCIISDFQEGVLATIPNNTLLSGRIRGDFTQLPILDAEKRPDSFGGIVALSRAIEHYISNEEFIKLITETGRILSPGELYVAQISSGSPISLNALSEGIRVIGGKEETFFSLDEYKTKVKGIKQSDGKTPIFDEVTTTTKWPQDYDPQVFTEITTGFAEAQTGRNSIAQARRYLNPHFLQLHSSVIRNNLEQYQAEIDKINKLRKELGATVKDEKSRLEAIAKLDGEILSTKVYHFFKNIYLHSIIDYLEKTEGIKVTPGLTLPGLKIIGDGENITDIELDVEYPIVVWQKNKKELIPNI